MSAERSPLRSGYDAVLEIGSARECGNYVVGLVKLTHVLRDERLERSDPEPLRHDFLDPELEPRLRADSEFWPRKGATDFVVRGSAFSTGGPTRRMRVSAAVGGRRKEIEVFGPRVLEWSADGRPRIPEPEPFESVPLVWENAYGGIDWRVPVEGRGKVATEVALLTDHPGLYPRNPWGKGYLVEDGAVPDMEMPNLEDPADLLDADRLVTGGPAAWYRQPLPWCFEWMSAAVFPRCIFFGPGADPWFPAPEDEGCPEVARGHLPPGYRASMDERGFVGGPDRRFQQAASHDLVVPALRGGEPVQLKGLHPSYPELRFHLPERVPAIEVHVEGRGGRFEPALFSIECRPADEIVTLVYGVNVPLERPLLPEVHKEIPVSMRVEEDEPIHYVAPEPVLDRLEAAQAEARSDEASAKREKE